MARVISFIALVAFVLVFAALFYQVIAPFLLPLFLAGVLALLFRPWYESITALLKGRRRLAAGVTTAVVVLIVLIPVASVLGMATVQLVRLFPSAPVVAPDESSKAGSSRALKNGARHVVVAPNAGEDVTGSAPVPDAEAAGSVGITRRGAAESPEAETAPPTRAATGGGSGKSDEPVQEEILSESGQAPDEAAQERSQPGALSRWKEYLVENIRKVVPVETEQINDAIQSTTKALADRTLSLIRDLAGFVVGLLITIAALYYFFIDGPRMLETMQRLTPMEDRHERELMRQFDTVCRAVVLATLTSAVVQGMLAGIGFLIVGLYEQVFLLSILTTLFAMIPLVGTFVVWGPVAVILAIQGHPGKAVFLGVYGAGCISAVDNLIKPYILHGRAKMHPLLALLSVLGGVQALGLWGIFVGPMVAAFLYALLNILHQEVQAFARADKEGRKELGNQDLRRKEEAAAGRRGVKKKAGKRKGATASGK